MARFSAGIVLTCESCGVRHVYHPNTNNPQKAVAEVRAMAHEIDGWNAGGTQCRGCIEAENASWNYERQPSNGLPEHV